MPQTITQFDRPNQRRYKRKRPGAALRITDDTLRVCKVNELQQRHRDGLFKLTGSPGTAPKAFQPGDGQVDLLVQAEMHLLKRIEEFLGDNSAHSSGNGSAPMSHRPEIRWSDVADKAIRYAEHLRRNQTELRCCLSQYECANVVVDEIERSVDVLVNLDENREYFTHAVRGVTTFLPLNQPIYATVCFGAIPSLMSQDVVVRPPTAMHATYQRLSASLKLEEFFPTLRVSYELDKRRFCQERASMTEAVIFTGTPENGENVRRQFDSKTLFILNGSGHNPIVVAESADLDAAIRSSLRVVLQNQGQDCAGPNAILVHRKLHREFLDRLIRELEIIKDCCGPYVDPNNIIGPNTDMEASLQVADRLVSIVKACPDAVVYGGTINPAERMIYPTVLDVPLRRTPSAAEIGLREWFAPIFFVQSYCADSQLQWYFEHPAYRDHAMYVTVFGESPYVTSLIPRGLHTEDNVLVNTDLHEVERGFLPYGGLGVGASHVAYRGTKRAGATLPQRDINLHLVKGSY